MNAQPIAVFDSGLGGLTVVRALQRHVPHESVVYFGDTARVPYGSKSSPTVEQFALQNCRFLMRFDPKLVVVACNTASALALESIARHIPVPLVGVIEPGAAEAVGLARGGRVAVLATEATVASEAYPKAIRALAPATPVIQQQCPSLVALIEEGRSAGDPILRMLLSEYLEGVRRLDPSVVLLGCTHYPLVAEAVEALMPGICVVDSAEATACTVKKRLTEEGGLAGGPDAGELRCYVSDNPQRFRAVGGRFLGHPIRDVTWVTPEQFFMQEQASSPLTDTNLP